MHYYKHNIGDYKRDTAHLTLLEHGVYRQLLDQYYLYEKPIELSEEKLMRSLCVRNANDMRVVKEILKEFFFETENGWINKRCDLEIDGFHAKSDKAKTSARARWDKIKSSRDANAMRTHIKRNANAMLTKEPINLLTNNIITKKKLDFKSKIPDDFLITDEMKIWAKEIGIKNIENQTELFKDHHTANGTKMVSWHAAWKKWMRQAVDWKTEDKAISNSRKGKEAYNINNDPNVTTVDGWFIPG